MGQLGMPAGLDDTMTPDIRAANAATQQQNAASRANSAANPASISDLSKRLGLMGGFAVSPQIPQEMIEANKKAAALTALEAPTNYSAEDMRDMMKSRQGGGDYAVPTTGGGYDTIGEDFGGGFNMYTPVTQSGEYSVMPQQGNDVDLTMPFAGGALTPYSGGRVPDYAIGGDYTGGKGFDTSGPDVNSPYFAGVGAPVPSGMGESSVGSVGYAAPTTGGGTTTYGGMGGPMGMMPQQGGIASLTPPPQVSQQPSNIAQSYMNPYLQSVLNPQLDELRRQNEITNMQANAKLTGAGAFGGGRQAIINAENARNLMQEQNKTVGQGYASAYDKAMGQFNTEQGQARDLANLMSTQGAQQRDIEQQGISADYNEFLAQRDDPMKKTQYLQSMLQGLPISTVSNQAAQQSGIGQLASTVGGMGNIMESLKKLGL
jgi:hypothetical protein